MYALLKITVVETTYSDVEQYLLCFFFRLNYALPYRKFLDGTHYNVIIVTRLIEKRLLRGKYD